jgi:hypothetical protein
MTILGAFHILKGVHIPIYIIIHKIINSQASFEFLLMYSEGMHKTEFKGGSLKTKVAGRDRKLIHHIRGASY